jgi:hypothetical protein
MKFSTIKYTLRSVAFSKYILNSRNSSEIQKDGSGTQKFLTNMDALGL